MPLSKKTVAHLQAGEVLVGTMIGVGVFGIPFAFAQAGFFVGMIYLVLLGLATITLQLMYAEVTLKTPGKHRFVGYMRRYFSKKWAVAAAFVFLGGSWGALVAYILIGGNFLGQLLIPFFGGTELVYQGIFLIVGFLFALGGLRLVSGAEMYLVGLLVVAMLVVILRGAFDIHLPNLMTASATHLLLPYGVVLFSLGGISVIPEMRDVLGRYHNDLRSVIIKSSLLVIILYAAFALAVVGVTGPATTQEALAGIGAALGIWVLIVGVLMGFLAVATSFLTLSLSIQDMLEFDYGFTKLLSWFLMLIVPLSLFVFGARDFIRVIGFTGAVFGGLFGCMVVALYRRVRNRYCKSDAQCFQLSDKVGVLIAIVFVIGALFEIVRPFVNFL